MANSTNAQIGSQTTLSYWNLTATPDAWTPIVNIKQFGEVGADKPEVDTTDLDSTGVERIGGLTDGKEITIVCIANTTTLPLLGGFYDAGDTLDLKVDFPPPMDLQRYFGFSPLGLSLGNVTPSGVIEISLRGRISGAITSTPSHP